MKLTAMRLDELHRSSRSGLRVRRACTRRCSANPQHAELRTRRSAVAILESAEPTVVTPELLADMMVVHGHYAEAIEAYRKIRPQNAQIYNKIGIAYQRMARDEDAIANYDQATRLDRKFAAPYNNLGTVYFHQNDNKRAQQLYKKSIKLDAATAPFWSNLGAVYMAQRQYSNGAEAYEKAFLLDPDIFQEIALNGIAQNESLQNSPKSTSRLPKSMRTPE